MPVIHIDSGRVAFAAILFATVPGLSGQTSRSLEWHLDQQPASVPCSSDDIAFVNAPEQISLEKSYNLLPHLPGSGADAPFEWQCESIQAPAFSGSRVLIISRPSVLDDGIGYTLILPRGSTNVRLIPFVEGGNLLHAGDVGDWHNRAAMNALLVTAEYGEPESIDWLAISLGYLTIIGNAPDLADRQYSPKPGEKYFKPYTVTGLLAELPSLRRKHLLPSLACDKDNYCTVRFYYRTEPVEPLQIADLIFRLEGRTLTLLQSNVQEYPESGKNKGRALR